MAKRIDLSFLLILTLALVPRLYLASTAEYIHDEQNTSIPLSQSISFDPAHLNLPLRGENHGALPAYIVKASSTLFGASHFGYRALHVLLGLLTVTLVFRLVLSWYGAVAARWAAALLAFNDYYLTISSRATAHVPHLLFVMLAVYAFARFLRRQRPRDLYLAGLCVGLAFYCKEHAALLVPVFFAMLLRVKYRVWLRTPHPYAACAVLVLLLAPDLLWNLRTDPRQAVVTYNHEPVAQATYKAHLQRLGGVGFSLYPAMFYGRTAVQSAYHAATGGELKDETPEYTAMNVALGALLLGALVVSTVVKPTGDDLQPFLLVFAWGYLAFFTLIKKGNPPYRLDPVSWIWVEATILPTAMLAGVRLAAATAVWRAASWLLAVGGLSYAVYAALTAVR
jgi:4-amino-4-deoxy-L-arabinose transferase-like glycosyltransferase